MSSDTYIWRIDDTEKLSQILNAKNGEMFTSDIFEINETKWDIKLYPNGCNKNNIGSFDIFCELKSIPSEWKHIIIARTIKSVQTKSGQSSICKYCIGNSFGWTPYTLSLKEIKQSNLQYLIFEIEIKMIQIVMRKNNHIRNCINFEYKRKCKLKCILDTKLLNILKNSQFGKCVISDMMNDNMWKIMIFPNGIGNDETSKGYFKLIPILYTLPLEVSKMSVKYRLFVDEINMDITSIYDYSDNGRAPTHTIMTLDRFKSLNSLNISIEIEILKEYNYDGILIYDNQCNEQSNIQKLIELNEKKKDEEIKELKEKLMSLDNIISGFEDKLIDGRKEIDILCSNIIKQKDEEIKSLQNKIEELRYSVSILSESEKMENQQINALNDKINEKYNYLIDEIKSIKNTVSLIMAKTKIQQQPQQQYAYLQ